MAQKIEEMKSIERHIDVKWMWMNLKNSKSDVCFIDREFLFSFHFLIEKTSTMTIGMTLTPFQKQIVVKIFTHCKRH